MATVFKTIYKKFDNEVLVEVFGASPDKLRTVRLIPGCFYVVNPLRLNKKKYRGELVQLVKLPDCPGYACEVLRFDSEWHKSRNILTKIDPSDLENDPKVIPF